MDKTNSLANPNSVANRSFRLISVNFKEAALDSPSFRASVNHLDGQLNNISHWANALAASLVKFPKRVQDLRVFVNSFTEHLLPSFAEDGILDQEITVPFLKDVSSCNAQLYKLCVAFLTVNTAPILELSEKINSLLTTYRTFKRQFDSTQEKFDKYLHIFMSSPKTKHPQMAVEDAYQLFIVKKAYLRAALDLVVVLNETSASVDSQFIRIGIALWSEKLRIGGDNGFLAGFQKETRRIKRTGAWAIAFESAMSRFKDDVKQARDQVEESSIDLFQPSREYHDYDASLINGHSLQEISESSCEKHGYLLMKTWISTLTKPIWVKRWVFVKGGVFGMLILSPSKTFVQETDKIGLFLINTRYAAQEERRFCFEVKTADMTVTLQAETLLELKSWLKVFDNEKARILNEDSGSQVFTIANSRYPPLITEFASTTDTLVDKQLTNTKIRDENGQIVTSSNLSSRIKLEENYFQKYLYHQIPLIKPPLMTSNTKSAIISYSIAASTSLPTALTANTWGSVNWGIYYIQKALSDNLSTDQSDDSTQVFDSERLFVRDNYPQGYPPYLVSLDIEMRALFESEIEVGELCLMTFSCLWATNKKQELCSRIFVTNKNILICNQALGFRSLFKSSVRRVVHSECVSQEDHDLLTIYFPNDSISVRVYVEDGVTCQKQLQFLINNRAEEKSKPLEEVIQELERIRNLSYETESPRQEAVPSIPSMVTTKDNKVNNCRLDYRAPNTLSLGTRFQVPAKALFHILLGDNSINSIVIPDLDSERTVDHVIKPWSKLPDGRLARLFVTAIKKPGFHRDNFLVEFIIDSMVDGQYYNIIYTRKLFSFFGSQFSHCVRFIIQADNADVSKLISYSTIEFEKLKPLNAIIRYLARRLQKNEMHQCHSALIEACKQLGSKGPVAKAVYLYGKLSVTEQPELNPPQAPICIFGTRLVFHENIEVPFLSGLRIIGGKLVEFWKQILSYLKEITAQRLLLFILTISIGFNFLLTSRTTLAYWTVRQAGKMADKMFHSEPVMLQRAVYLKDLHEISEFSVDGINVSNRSDSQALESFNKKSFVRNFESPINWEEEYFDYSTREAAVNLKKMFQEIGVKRHKLLIEFNILNQMESEVAKGEYRNWLISELRRCALVQSADIKGMLQSQNITENDPSIVEGINTLKDYCGVCSEEFSALNLI